MRPSIEVITEPCRVVVTATGGTETDRTSVLLVTAGLASQAGFEVTSYPDGTRCGPWTAVVLSDYWGRDTELQSEVVAKACLKAEAILGAK